MTTWAERQVLGAVGIREENAPPEQVRLAAIGGGITRSLQQRC